MVKYKKEAKGKILNIKNTEKPVKKYP